MRGRRRQPLSLAGAHSSHHSQTGFLKEIKGIEEIAEEIKGIEEIGDFYLPLNTKLADLQHRQPIGRRRGEPSDTWKGVKVGRGSSIGKGARVLCSRSSWDGVGVMK